MYIDHAVFRPIPITPKTYDMIFVGRLASNKGLDRLLAVFNTVEKNIPSVRLLILGSGPYGVRLARQIGHNPRITHIERVPLAADVALLYNRSRVAVCTSFSEGGPRYMVEAMACGVPAVSTSVGLMSELVRDGENGFLVDPLSVEIMAEHIVRILHLGEAYAIYSTNAVRAVSYFEYEKGIAEYARAYHELIAV